MVRGARRFALLFWGLTALCLLVAAPAQATHPRPKGAFVPGMTAEVLVSPDLLKGTDDRQNAKAGKQ